ncbi:TonB-dependent receptor domain-containing protein [Terrihabitans sp. B22-R8]|uniref:TonB-dependent receptor domain-containing protein n=1 Tax=Terrihabitans sp. B22-R8 TaxID=3425128 RepID=UPI00403C8E84
MTFSIPAQTLAGALNAFGSAAGVQVIYDASLAVGKRSPGISGRHTPEQALSALVAGTGLSAYFTAARTASIIDPRAFSAGADAAVDGDVIQLETIEVGSGGGGPVAAADAPYESPGSPAYVSEAQLDRVRTGAPSDLFKSTAGVISASGRSNQALNVNIRGMQGQNRVNTSVDGTTQSFSTYRGYAGVDNRTFVDPDFIAGIAIDKGPKVGADGAGYNGGVLNMRTLNADDIVKDGKQWGVRLKGDIGDNTREPVIGANVMRAEPADLFDFESGSGNVVGALSFDNFELLAAFGRRKAGNYFAGTEGDAGFFQPSSGGSALRPLDQAYIRGGEVFNTSSDTTSGMVKTAFKNEDHRVEFGYSYYDSEFGDTLYGDVRGTTTTQRQKPLNHVEVNTYRSSYTFNPGDSGLWDLKVNAWKTDATETQYSRLGTSNASRADNETDMFGFDLSNTSRFDTAFGDIAWVYGYSHAKEETAPIDGPATTILGVDGQRQVDSVFTSVNYKPTDWLVLNVGVSHVWFDLYGAYNPGAYPVDPVTFDPVTDIDLDGSGTTPVASVTVEPWAGLQLFAKYAEGYRPPSIRELANPIIAVVNRNLKPEQATTWEFGVNVARDALLTERDSLRVKLAYFDNTYDDYIIRGAGDLGVGLIENADGAWFSGFEIQANYDARFLFVESAFTYYDEARIGCPANVAANDCDGGAYFFDYSMFHIPPEWTLSTTIGVRLLDERLTFGTRINHASERKGGRPEGNRSSWWNSYTIADFFASYAIKDAITLNASVENVTDRFYMDALNVTPMPAPGRTVRFGMTAQF